MIKKSRRGNRPVEVVIGQRVRTLRMQLGMSQGQLGDEVGVSFQQIQKYEKGTNRISVSRMLEFCEHLQTTPNEIIGWGTTTAAVNGITSRLFSTARDFEEMPEDVQIAMRKIADALMAALKKKR